MQKKRYDGHKSFQYLVPGEDYKPFELAKEAGRVEPAMYPVSEEQEQTCCASSGKAGRSRGGRHAARLTPCLRQYRVGHRPSDLLF